MVEAEEGNSWIYKNKDHGKPDFLLSFSLLKEVNRHDERRGFAWS